MGNAVSIQKDSRPSFEGRTFFCLMEPVRSVGQLFELTSGFSLRASDLTSQVAATRGCRFTLDGCLASAVAWPLERLFSRALLALISSTRCVDLWNSSWRFCWSPPGPQSNSRNQAGRRKCRGSALVCTKKKIWVFVHQKLFSFTCLVFAPVLEHGIGLYLILQHRDSGKDLFYVYILY